MIEDIPPALPADDAHVALPAVLAQVGSDGIEQVHPFVEQSDRGIAVRTQGPADRAGRMVVINAQPTLGGSADFAALAEMELDLIYRDAQSPGANLVSMAFALFRCAPAPHFAPLFAKYVSSRTFPVVRAISLYVVGVLAVAPIPTPAICVPTITEIRVSSGPLGRSLTLNGRVPTRAPRGHRFTIHTPIFLDSGLEFFV